MGRRDLYKDALLTGISRADGVPAGATADGLALQVAESTSDRETLICCLDCDATFERHQKGKERRKSKHDYDDDYGSQGKRR